MTINVVAFKLCQLAKQLNVKTGIQGDQKTEQETDAGLPLHC